MQHNEKQMREQEAAIPKTIKELSKVISELVDGEHDYGTCVYAMSLAATAAFNFVASKLGVTGFQASCADLDIVRRTRSIDGPFMLIKGEDALYPQYDLRGKLDKALDDWKPWLKEQAQKKLTDTTNAHPDVVKHWHELAS